MNSMSFVILNVENVRDIMLKDQVVNTVLHTLIFLQNIQIHPRFSQQRVFGISENFPHSLILQLFSLKIPFFLFKLKWVVITSLKEQ